MHICCSKRWIAGFFSSSSCDGIGGHPLSYSWLKDGVALVGETGKRCQRGRRERGDGDGGVGK